ncbi:GNAT family N-acetyltransferase [Novosphingobium sp. 1949]|uniref:GNAT family N-acetyltransferase n=1 Tax=Novosphingobium organovorum TaxID=2930092 RepID=A0ABT0BBV5_9SPHN|nr:GNAT family N-acetyltransferase [Novosphingobium organovorum]MCJ2182343.1 GNAT family N-acetyltransferase [Novosphingobium organovorum]
MTEDIDKLMDVMNAAFDPVYGEAWTRRQVEDSLIFGHTYYCLIAEDGSEPDNDTPAAGFSLSRHGFGEEELLLLAVSPKHRRRGLGKILLDKLSISSNKRGAERLLLEMRKGNPAESLYTTFGFYRIGERPNYYRMHNGELVDAITFACDLKN